MSVVELDEIVILINDLLLEASETGNYVSSGYSSHINELNDMLVFGDAVARKLNAILEHLDYDYILMKRNDLYTKIEWSIGYHGDLEITIQVNSSSNF